MQVGDTVDYYADAPSVGSPQVGRVAEVIGGAWVSLRLADGSLVQQVRAVAHPWQAPLGGCCVSRPCA